MLARRHIVLTGVLGLIVMSSGCNLGAIQTDLVKTLKKAADKSKKAASPAPGADEEATDTDEDEPTPKPKTSSNDADRSSPSPGGASIAPSASPTAGAGASPSPSPSSFDYTSLLPSDDPDASPVPSPSPVALGSPAAIVFPYTAVGERWTFSAGVHVGLNLKCDLANQVKTVGDTSSTVTSTLTYMGKSTPKDFEVARTATNPYSPDSFGFSFPDAITKTTLGMGPLETITTAAGTFESRRFVSVETHGTYDVTTTFWIGTGAGAGLLKEIIDSPKAPSLPGITDNPQVAAFMQGAATITLEMLTHTAAP